MSSLGLVVADFYEELAEEMEEQAREMVDPLDAEIVETVHVRGVYDSPLAADRLARRDDIDAVSVLGAVITGDTDHDQVVAHTAARKLSDVSLDRDTPVTFGILGPEMSAAEAHERIEYGADAVPIAVETVEELPS
jgi:6,7-dimethyl-8-ribityllumazine synthase